MWEEATRGNRFLGHNRLVRQALQRFLAPLTGPHPVNSKLRAYQRNLVSLTGDQAFLVPKRQIGHKMPPKLGSKLRPKGKGL